jgi:hypothetical protein
MSSDKIDLTLPVAGHESRLLVFPDGVTRHITLLTWEWKVFDAVPHRDLLPAGAYHHALTFWLLDIFNFASAPHDRRGADAGMASGGPAPERRGFEPRLRRSLSRMIHANMRSITGGEPPANDEFP